MTLLSLVPKPKPTARKPVYERVPLYGLIVVDRRAQWQERRDALESEQTRAKAQAISRAATPPVGG